MNDLQKYHAKICLTATGALVVNKKVLLIKHKKLGFWLLPGGHIEEDELPHQAAEREVFEETGVVVRTTKTGFQFHSSYSECVPTPLISNLHWVCQDNYQKRTAGMPLTDPNWKRGCEQHLNLQYMVEPVAGVEVKFDEIETLGIDWFGIGDIEQLETSPDIKQELKYILSLDSENL